MQSWRRCFSFFLVLLFLGAMPVEARDNLNHYDGNTGIGKPVAKGARPEVDPNQAVSPEVTRKLEAQISDWSQQDKVEPESVSNFLDDLVNGLSKEEQNELLSALLEKYPESAINASWRRQAEARLKPLDELVHSLGSNEEGDVPAIRRADQFELQRRIEQKLGVDTETARRLALMVGSGGAHGYQPPGPNGFPAPKSPEQKLRVGLSQAFTPEEQRKLEQQLVKANPQDPALGELKRNLMGGLKLIQEEGGPPSPLVSTGNLLPETQNGNFSTNSNLTYLSEARVVDAIIEKGGRVTLVGPIPHRDFEEGMPGVSYHPNPSRGDWHQDSRGLLVTGPDGKRYLVDPRYHGGPQDDTLPQTEGKLSGLPVKPYGLYVEGGNTLAIPRDKNGKPVVITSDGYVKTNALLEGTYPEFAEQLFRTQFAADGRTVLQVPMPQDGTRHVDMNISQPDQGKPTVFLSTYLDKHVDLLSSSDQRHARASLRILDTTAEMLEPYVDVVRVPQAPPVTMKPGASQTHFSKLNALYFTNPEGDKVAIVPDYPTYPNLGVNSETNDFNRRALENMGYQIVIPTPHYTPQRNGAFHCMFPQVCY